MSQVRKYVQYATVIISIADLRRIFIRSFPRFAREFNISIDQEEYLYDWLVTEAMNRTLSARYQTQVFQHYRHDVYKCVYDSLGGEFEFRLHHQILIHNLQFLEKHPVKLLVTSDNLILARSPITSL